jgi:YaiO family outer membrane protein
MQSDQTQMKSVVLTSLLLAGIVASCWQAARADEAPSGGNEPAASEPQLTLKMSGYLEAGASDDLLTGGFPNRHAEFVRGEIRPEAGERWMAEINEITQFGDTGTLFVAGYENEIAQLWIVQAGVSSSAGGITLPRLRLDLALGKKWLDEHNLVTTVGITEVQSKDVHRDHALQFSTAYFFDISGQPWAVEGGVLHNASDPGSIGATSYYAALTTGREKERVVSLRIGAGREAYQLVGSSIALDNFPSNTLLFTWREWLTKDYGFQLRVDTYHNPFYDRRGIEASWFAEF